MPSSKSTNPNQKSRQGNKRRHESLGGKNRGNHAESNKGRRSRRGKRGNRWRKREDEDVMASIEEQLQKQREEQKKQHTANQEEDERKPPPAQLGRFVYDNEKATYFPKNAEAKKSQQSETLKKSHASTPPRYSNSLRREELRSMAPFTFLQTCPDKNIRARMMANWGGRVLFTALHVISVQPPLQGWRYCEDDLYCKSQLHPSCRTFDVMPTPSGSPCIVTNKGHDNLLFSNHQSLLTPTQCTSVRHLPAMVD